MTQHTPLRVFIGYDHRQAISYNVAQFSIISQSSKPVAITPLVLPQLPLQRQGLTPFTYSRFLVPYLCNYEGWALFMDSDMLLNADIAELFALADDKYAVMVAKELERFEWASVMLFNCAKCKMLTPEFVQSDAKIMSLEWLKDEEIGALPKEWNHLVGYDAPKPNPKLIHYTQGIPAFLETKSSEHADKWSTVQKAMNGTVAWEELMGNSVHAATVNGFKVPRYMVDVEKKKPAAGFEQPLVQLIEAKMNAQKNSA